VPNNRQQVTVDRRTPSPDAEIATIAARQHGVVTIAQLLASCSDATVRRRVRAGRLHRVYRGVYAVGHAGLSREGMWLAAVFACGENAALSHLAAAAHWQVSRWPSTLTSVVTVSKHAPAGVDVHRVARLDQRDVIVWKGIPVTNVARMLVDLTDTLTPHQLAYVIHEAEFKRIFSEPATRGTMARAKGRRNLHRLARALELHAAGSAGTRSAKEDAFLEAQDVEPLVNVKIEVDFHWPEKHRIVEIDGHGHGREATRRDDKQRDERLKGAGWSVERRAS